MLLISRSAGVLANHNDCGVSDSPVSSVSMPLICQSPKIQPSHAARPASFNQFRKIVAHEQDVRTFASDVCTSSHCNTYRRPWAISNHLSDVEISHGSGGTSYRTLRMESP